MARRRGAGSLVRSCWLGSTLLYFLVIGGDPAWSSGPRDLAIQGAELKATSWDALARQLMNQGRLREASAVLDAHLAVEPGNVQARFLKGMIAVAEHDHRVAVRIFRSILIDQPDAVRVRLELARAFYLQKDYGNALRQFQFALAGEVPPEVAANIRSYIASIREAKSLSYSFGIAVAPDSNLNTGSAAREVTLFGLPFDLSEETRQKSGVGLAVEGAAEWAPRIGRGKRLRLGASAQRREYPGSKFDDMALTGYAGPRLVAGQWDLSLLATSYRRWFGHKPYNQAHGLRLEATHHFTPRLGVSGAAAIQRINYRSEEVRNGKLLSLNVSAFRAVTASSAVTVKAGLNRQTARLDAYSSSGGFIAAGYFKELPLGFSTYVEPSFSFARYDAALIGFGRKRRDNTGSVLVTLLNRHLVLSRFTPRVSYTFTRQASSIALYDFTRNRVELGLTTSF